MSTQRDLERCQAFINCQLQPGAQRSFGANGHPKIRAVTISRQAGCGALKVGTELADYLRMHGPKGASPWAVFDRNLVERVLEDHNLPKRLARFMPEDRISEFEDTIDELFGLHPSSWALVRETADTILHLAELGNVILIGRGANIITSKLESVFHVRLVASLEKRVIRIQESDHLDRNAALEFIRREDRGRARYLKKYFQKDIDDPLLYHLVINTDRVGYEKAAMIIGDIVLNQRPARQTKA